MKQDEAERLILGEWDNWKLLNLQSDKQPSGTDALIFLAISKRIGRIC
jgi:hypothetical protein